MKEDILAPNVIVLFSVFYYILIFCIQQDIYSVSARVSANYFITISQNFTKTLFVKKKKSINESINSILPASLF
jgi:hypothetical protein